ncbi:hypothetical protein Tco_1528409, partial [Tanacetum coccineum]
MTKRAIRIAQSKVLSPVADEPASLPRDDSHGEAFPTTSSLDAGHDRENIIQTSAIPHDSPPRVTSLDGDEGSLKHKLNELMDFCTTLQSQQSQMAKKIQTQDLEISQLKARIKVLEDAQKLGEDTAKKEASKSTDKGSESTGEMTNILSTMGAANVLASGGLKDVVATASPQVSHASLLVPTASTIDTPAVATAGEEHPTAITGVATSYARKTRASIGIVLESLQPSQTISMPTYNSKGKEKMKEPKKPSKKKMQEQLSEQAARRLEQEFAQEDQAVRDQLAI